MPAWVQSAAPRAVMYHLLEQPFRFPDAETTQAFITGEWQKNVIHCATQIGFSPTEGSDFRLGSGIKEFEVEFISLFEVGMGGAPCPLHSGHYTRNRMVTMEETLRFYRFFNYSPDRSADRFPDHINFELQFMACLADTFETAQVKGGDTMSPLLAQRDFLHRHLVSWLPELSQLIDERATIEFFKQAGRLLRDFTTHDSAMLDIRVGKLEPA